MAICHGGPGKPGQKWTMENQILIAKYLSCKRHGAKTQIHPPRLPMSILCDMLDLKKKNSCCKLIKSTWLYTPDVQDIVWYSWHSQMSLPNSPSSHCQHLTPLPNHKMKVFSGQHLAWPLSGCHLHTKISAMGRWG